MIHAEGERYNFIGTSIALLGRHGGGEGNEDTAVPASV